MVSVNDWRFLNATLQDYWTGQVGLVLFAVWRNPIGQTIGVTTGGISMVGGESANCLVPVFNVEPGTYVVFLFVVSANNNPLSSVVTLSISLSSS